MHFRHELLLVMAFECYESDQQISEILNKIDEVSHGMKTDAVFSSIKFAFQAVEIEFAEEAESNYQHRDRQKETNVLEWIARCILEPLQVRLINCTSFIQGLK